MLYLFNSGFRSLYVRNVLNTLFIPSGGTNEYRCRLPNPESNRQGNIDPTALASLKRYPRNAPVAITFIDRFSNDGYVYHPLRLGRSVNVYEQNGYLHFNVRMDRFIYPLDNASFNDTFKHKLESTGIPKLTSDDPFNLEDGFYAVIGESVFEQRSSFYSPDRVWSRIVDEIHTCMSFSGEKVVAGSDGPEVTGEAEFVFARCEINKHTGTSVKPTLRNNTAYFDLVKGRTYEISLAYKYPSQLTDSASRTKVECQLGDNLKALGSPAVNIESVTDRVRVPFTTKRYVEDDQDGISFSFGHDEVDRNVVGADARLLIGISESGSYIPQLVGALVLLTLLSVVNGADLSKIQPLTCRNLFDALWIKLLVSFAHAVVLLWLLRLFGKKFPQRLQHHRTTRRFLS